MLTGIGANNYRGIKDGVLNGLTPIVVLVGPNGCGKSSLLDAALIAGNPIPSQGVKTACDRRPRFRQSSRWIVRVPGERDYFQQAVLKASTDLNEYSEVWLSTQINSPGTHFKMSVSTSKAGVKAPSLQSDVRFNHDGTVAGFGQAQSRPLEGVQSMRLVDVNGIESQPTHTLFTHIVQSGRKARLIQVVRELLPDMENIEILTEGDSPILNLVYANRAIPLPATSDGERWLIQVACELVDAAGGVILIEEPETHLHPAAMRVMARLIRAVATGPTQVIMTSHSLEFIDALIDGASDVELSNMSLYRLALDNGTLRSSRLAGSDIATARFEIASDLR